MELTNGEPVIHEVYPLLHVRGGAAAIDFYKRVFGAQEVLRLAYPNGRIAHAELKLGLVTLMLADEHPEYGVLSPLAFGGTGSSITFTSMTSTGLRAGLSRPGRPL